MKDTNSFVNFVLHKWIRTENYKGASQICVIFLNFLILLFKLIFCGVILLITVPHLAANHMLNKKKTSISQKISYVLLVIISFIFDIPLIFASLIGIFGFVEFAKGVFTDIFMIFPTIIFGALAILTTKILVNLVIFLFSKKITDVKTEEIQRGNIVYESDEEVLLKKNNFDDMNGFEFEYFCADILHLHGFTNIELTAKSGDQGIDIIAEKDNTKWGFQCKHYTQKVGNLAVRETYAGMAFYHCDVGVVITNSRFTVKAIECANELGIVLWDRTKLLNIIKLTGIDFDISHAYKPHIENSESIDRRMKEIVQEFVNNYGAGKHIVTTKELCDLLNSKYSINRDSIIPSDYCYNRVNNGINSDKKPMLLEYLGRGRYCCLGENFPYNGDVYHKENVVGICENGKRKLHNPK